MGLPLFFPMGIIEWTTSTSTNNLIPPEAIFYGDEKANFLTQNNPKFGQINGLGGNDTIVGNGWTLALLGGTGNDLLYAGNRDSQLTFGDEGNDTIYGSSVGGAIDGGAGNDIIYGGNTGDFIKGGAGNDLIYGSDASDMITGMEGNDTIHGGGDLDILHGDSGNDLIFGHSGEDSIYGGAGFDIAAFDDTSLNFTFSSQTVFDYKSTPMKETKVTNLITGEVDTLIDIEALQFQNTQITI